MTEIEYRKLLIDSVRAGDYPEKDGLLELLNICSLRFEKTNVFTRNLWNHFQEYIHICIVPEKMIELKKHADYLKKMIYEIYPPNDDYELWGVEIKPGAMPDTEDISQEILFENIRINVNTPTSKVSSIMSKLLFFFDSIQLPTSLSLVS